MKHEKQTKKFKSEEKNRGYLDFYRQQCLLKNKVVYTDMYKTLVVLVVPHQ